MKLIRNNWLAPPEEPDPPEKEGVAGEEPPF